MGAIQKKALNEDLGEVARALRTVYATAPSITARHREVLKQDFDNQMDIIDMIVNKKYEDAKIRYFEMDTEPREKMAYALQDYAPEIFDKIFGE